MYHNIQVLEKFTYEYIIKRRYSCKRIKKVEIIKISKTVKLPWLLIPKLRNDFLRFCMR